MASLCVLAACLDAKLHHSYPIADDDLSWKMGRYAACCGFTTNQNKGAAIKPTRHKSTILKQVMEHIPAYEVSKLARKHGIDGHRRAITPWSHVTSLVYAPIAHSFGLNDVCDTLENHSAALATSRGAAAPSRNGLSHANRTRNTDMAEALFWSTLAMCRQKHPGFGIGLIRENPYHPRSTL